MSRRPVVATAPEEAQSRLRAVLAAGLCEPCGKPFKTWERARKSKYVKEYKNLDRFTECGICMNPLFQKSEYGDETVDVEVLIESCGHAFHLDCLKGVIMAGGRNCPLCRVPIKRKVLQRLGEDTTIEEGEEQRLGNRSRNPDEADWYDREEGRARANNPENDDGMLDPEEQDGDDRMFAAPDPFEGYEGEELKDAIRRDFQLNDNDDVNLVHAKLIRVHDRLENLEDTSLPLPFNRWVLYAMKTCDVSPPYCERWIPKILDFARNDPRVVDFNSIVIEAIKMVKRDDSFECLLNLKTYLEGINADPILVFGVDLAIEAKQYQLAIIID